jgi:hypothetical protein
MTNVENHPFDPFVLENRTSATIYPKGVRPDLEVAHSFSFVLNVSQLVNQSPDAALFVAPGHELRRAANAEVVAIKDVLTNFAAIRSFEAWRTGKTVTEDRETSLPQDPEDQWRYFIIAFEGSNSTTAEIERTLCIAPFELKMGFTLLKEAIPSTGAPMLIYHPARLFTQVHRATHGGLPFVEVTSAAVKSLSLLHDQVRKQADEPLNLRRLTEQVLDLDALPYESPLLFLGHFAILESLVTHQPKKTDTIDSITRQVKQKVLLLNNRWQPRIDYSPFEESKPDTIWSKMYSYRSCLAHGGEPDFKGDLQLLGNPDRALNLLKQTVTGVLRQALIEPQLIVDLRNC